MADQSSRKISLRGGMTLDEAARHLSALHSAKDLTDKEQHLLGIAEGLLDLVRLSASIYMDSEAIEADLYGTTQPDEESPTVPLSEAEPIRYECPTLTGKDRIHYQVLCAEALLPEPVREHDPDACTHRQRKDLDRAHIDALDLPAEFTAQQSWWSEWDPDRGTVHRFNLDPDTGDLRALVPALGRHHANGHIIEVTAYLKASP